MAKASLRAWQRMLSGRRLDLLDPSAMDIEIEDIAHGLSRVARWNGQTSGEWAFSVADHSLLVEEVCRRLKPSLSPNELMCALLHDAPEYVIGDLISPFKAMIGGDYKALENRLLNACLIAFTDCGEMAAPLKRLVKRADHVAAYLEATQLAGFSVGEADKIFGRPRDAVAEDLMLVPRPPNEAKRAFLARFAALAEAQRAA
ncbi:MAG: HD family hydrolase [Pseudomonadota bacterium]